MGFTTKLSDYNLAQASTTSPEVSATDDAEVQAPPVVVAKVVSTDAVTAPDVSGVDVQTKSEDAPA